MFRSKESTCTLALATILFVLNSHYPLFSSILKDHSDAIQQLRRSMHHRKRIGSQFGLVFPHCKESNTAWLKGIETVTIPDHDGIQHFTKWDAQVYERCGQKTSKKYSEWQLDVGPEECTAYLRYIISRYDSMPEIVYFVNSDSLEHTAKKESDKVSHHPTSFSTVQDMVAASAPLMMDNAGSDKKPLGFLNLGDESMTRRAFEADHNPTTILNYMKDRAPEYDDESQVIFVPGAFFAVRREQILAHPVEMYKDLLLDIAKLPDELAVSTCRDMEATWHVLFGEPLALPDTARLMKYVHAGVVSTGN